MTVVAYRDGIMAADRMVVTDQDTIVGEITKIRAICGVLIGATGRTQEIHLFEQWVLDGRPKDAKPKMSDLFMGLLIEKDRTVRRYNEFLEDSATIAPYHAIGCGTMAALGAMWAGADAPSAVEAAIAHTLGCGCGIDILKLEETNHA